MTDTLLTAFKKIMSMTDFQTSWIQIAFYGSYFCLALPAAIFIKKFSYKAGVLLGLGMFVVESLLFYPVSINMDYSHFIGVLYILAGGLSIRGLGEDTKIGGSGLIMAILGGAVLTSVQGQVSDLTGSISLAYFVPFLCFLFIAFYAYFKSGKDLSKINVTT